MHELILYLKLKDFDHVTGFPGLSPEMVVGCMIKGMDDDGMGDDGYG